MSRTVKLCLQLQHITIMYNMDVETQSLRAIIQPGSLIYQVENSPACLGKSCFLPGQKTQLDCCSGGLDSDASVNPCMF